MALIAVQTRYLPAPTHLPARIKATAMVELSTGRATVTIPYYDNEETQKSTEELHYKAASKVLSKLLPGIYSGEYQAIAGATDNGYVFTVITTEELHYKDIMGHHFVGDYRSSFVSLNYKVHS